MREWIKVSDRMPLEAPPEGEYVATDVLASDGYRVAQVTCTAGNPLTDSGHIPWVEFTNYGEIGAEDITHWMPLPEPPKE